MNYELSRKKIIIFRVSLAFLFGVSFALLPLVATAALVPCGPGSGGDEVCTWGHFYVLAENVIEFMIYYIAIPLSVIFFAIGGILIMTAAGSEERFKKGKSTLTAAAIGLIIVLCSWLIIGLIIQALCKTAGSTAPITFKPWKTIESCDFEETIQGAPGYE